MAPSSSEDDSDTVGELTAPAPTPPPPPLSVCRPAAAAAGALAALSRAMEHSRGEDSLEGARAGRPVLPFAPWATSSACARACTGGLIRSESDSLDRLRLLQEPASTLLLRSGPRSHRGGTLWSFRREQERVQRERPRRNALTRSTLGSRACTVPAACSQLDGSGTELPRGVCCPAAGGRARSGDLLEPPPHALLLLLRLAPSDPALRSSRGGAVAPLGRVLWGSGPAPAIR